LPFGAHIYLKGEKVVASLLHSKIGAHIYLKGEKVVASLLQVAATIDQYQRLLLDKETHLGARRWQRGVRMVWILLHCNHDGHDEPPLCFKAH
jgi:hypothetical protein